MKHEIGEVWKDHWDSKKIWRVQFPNGILGFRTKKEAVKHSEEIRKITW